MAIALRTIYHVRTGTEERKREPDERALNVFIMSESPKVCLCRT